MDFHISYTAKPHAQEDKKRLIFPVYTVLHLIVCHILSNIFFGVPLAVPFKRRRKSYLAALLETNTVEQ